MLLTPVQNQSVSTSQSNDELTESNMLSKAQTLTDDYHVCGDILQVNTYLSFFLDNCAN